jgi:glycosyltransferase involved in cell wall biosynthesis
VGTKKTILHFIYNLGRGGAETMLVRVLKELPQYRNIVVTLHNKNNFGAELQCDELICMNKPSLLSLLSSAAQLKKLIRKYEVDMVHSHLPQCNFAARLAVPKDIPLITTIHTSVATATGYKKWYIRALDRFTYRFKKSYIIGVSEVALQDYFSMLHLKPCKTFVLYTFVDTAKYNRQAANKSDNTFRIVSVGALRKGKNYLYLTEAFKKIDCSNIEVHIYGEGPEKETLQLAIEKAGVPFILKGQVNNIHEVLAQYDLFVMPSLFEGFSLSVLEAMAVQLPLLLSDIPSFKEQCAGTALYFDLNDTGDFIAKFNQIILDKPFRDGLALAAKQRVMNNFTLPHHMQGLNKIYDQVLSNQ